MHLCDHFYTCTEDSTCTLAPRDTKQFSICLSARRLLIHSACRSYRIKNKSSRKSFMAREDSGFIPFIECHDLASVSALGHFLLIAKVIMHGEAVVFIPLQAMRDEPGSMFDHAVGISAELLFT